jgi:hypothetical protein
MDRAEWRIQRTSARERLAIGSGVALFAITDRAKLRATHDHLRVE